VLVVEDEPDVAELIRFNLFKEGYEVVVVGNGADAVRRARDSKPDVILLDIMVPQLNGWEVCRRLKQDDETRRIPIIMVTGRVDEGDKVLGFELGADDYVTKPFSARELLARVRAVTRRGRAADGADKKRQLKVGELEIDRDRFEVRMNGRPVELTPKEFELLATLAGAPGRVFARGDLLDLVWGAGGVRRAPHGGRARGPAARQVHRREGAGAGRGDCPGDRLPVSRCYAPLART
jgi:DNA-binding response OmpR family regulator